MTVKERYRLTLEWFAQSMPVAETELRYGSPFQLLVAVILSAQCTDKRVNMITPPLFEAYPTAEAMSQAGLDDIFGYIRSVSYPNNKAKALLGASKMIVEEFGGEVPSDIDSLMRLPGVGRKTANSKTPLATEKQLCRYIPEELIPKAHHWLILHGRYVCKARRPDCLNCGLTEVCRYYLREGKEE